MKIRVKMRAMPGDVSKSAKIAMLERRDPRSCSKTFRDTVRSRERAAFREQSKCEVTRHLEDVTEEVMEPWTPPAFDRPDKGGDEGDEVDLTAFRWDPDGS